MNDLYQILVVYERLYQILFVYEHLGTVMYMNDLGRNGERYHARSIPDIVCI